MDLWEFLATQHGFLNMAIVAKASWKEGYLVSWSVSATPYYIMITWEYDLILFLGYWWYDLGMRGTRMTTSAISSKERRQTVTGTAPPAESRCCLGWLCNSALLSNLYRKNPSS